jgi:hypothetical protein
MINPFRKEYYWIYTKYEGRNVLIFGGSSEKEARDIGWKKLSGMMFEVKKLPTKNMDSAMAMLRGDQLGTDELGNVLKPMKHKI